jgi:amidophosphoribosyltransferase
MSNQYESDKLKEECAVYGVFNHDDASALTVLGLHALQHRGQEATGIVSYDGSGFNVYKSPELVGKAYSEPSIMEKLSGKIAIGHNRYSTSGDTIMRNIQPLYADLAFGGFAIAHNGNLTNSNILRTNLVNKGALFQTTTDTEVIVHLMAKSQKSSVEERLIDALKHIEGAYSLVACTENRLLGARDPYGIRPLVLGQLGDSFILASESCALDVVGAEFVRDIEAGEVVLIDKNGLQSFKPFKPQKPRFCVFEYIYFARPDSYISGYSVYEMRKKIGAELAKEAPCEADIVVPVPDSGVPAALGYAEQSGLPFELGIIRSHYVGRSFIQPTEYTRDLSVLMKHNANKSLIEGKRLVLVDDSIVRGTTSKRIVEMLRKAGAREVHMRISSPPTSHSCFYGIDTPLTEELIANKMSIDDIALEIGVDSLHYLSLDGLYKAFGEKGRDNQEPQFCDACFSGDYMIKLSDYDTKNSETKVTDLNEKRRKAN